jgi:hypothetical protein
MAAACPCARSAGLDRGAPTPTGAATARPPPSVRHSRGLRERGYHFVTVSELLDAGEPDTKPEC